MSGEHLVVTLHGIQTFGNWQSRLEKLLTEKAPHIKVYNFRYGYFSILAFIVPFTRWLIVRRFGKELVELIKRQAPARVDIVAHSFGTHIAVWALKRLKPDDSVNVHTVILAGSVLRSDFYWPSLVPQRIKRVINDCGSVDLALIPSQFLVPLTGMAGRTGFVGLEGSEFRNRYSVFGHSGYFRNAAGEDDDQYMHDNWLPLIVTEEPVKVFDLRKTPSPLSGLSIWLTNNFEPVKLAIILTPFVLALIGVSALYIESNAAKDRIEGTIGLASIMKARGDLDPKAVPLLETLQRALNVPLRRTHVLWVDDNEKANRFERAALAKFGLCFTRVGTTAAALREIEENNRYSIIISDFRRDHDPQPGYGLLDELKKRGTSLPYIFYVANFTPEQATQARERGAQSEIRGALPLVEELFKALNPEAQPMSKTQLIVDEVLGCPD